MKNYTFCSIPCYRFLLKLEESSHSMTSLVVTLASSPTAFTHGYIYWSGVPKLKEYNQLIWFQFYFWFTNNLKWISFTKMYFVFVIPMRTSSGLQIHIWQRSTRKISFVDSMFLIVMQKYVFEMFKIWNWKLGGVLMSRNE